MFGTTVMLILAYGALNWSFSWWVWVLIIFFDLIFLSVIDKGENG
jgi:hypothetical protein